MDDNRLKVVRPLVIEHGAISGVYPIALEQAQHCHKITVSKGITIIPLRIIINNMQVEYELEIEV